MKTIRSIMKYIFIIDLSDVLGINILLYKIDQNLNYFDLG